MAERRRSIVLFLWLAAGVAVAGLFVLFAFTNPFQSNAFLPRCVFRETTGYLCPGCGTGRATHSLLHGRWGLAWRCNPLFIVALPLILLGVANEVARAIRGRPLWPWRMPSKVMLAIGVVVLAYGVIRNIPHPALDPLRPPTRLPGDENDQEDRKTFADWFTVN